MSDCCSNSSSRTSTQSCPDCGKSCKSVELHTLHHQVKFPENQAISSGSYYFCSAKDCAIAYFSSTGKNIAKQQLTTYQDILKDKLCYCFDIDSASYLNALGANSNHAEAIKDFVIQRTKSGECACELRNPSGQCCLAKFKQLEKHSLNRLTEN